jgi:iron uptake system component EfeO
MTNATSTPPSRATPLAVAGAALLAVIAGVLFYYASQKASGPAADGDVHQVTIRDKTCTPNAFTLPAGRTTFEIVNESDRALEWEILDGVMVVEERENIAPGFRSLLTARLKPGQYEITCGLLSNPRGTLVVTPSAESEAARARPPLTAFIGPLSEFKVFLALQSGALVNEAGKLAAAIKAGDLDAARAQYLATRLPYKRIEAVTGRMADLENSIDPIADYLDKREADPAFTGFHRIEYGLFSENSLDGLAPVADKLVADVTDLKTRLRAMKLAPEDLAGSAERLARWMAEGQIQQGESRYASADRAEYDANLTGMEKSVLLLDPLLEGAAPAIAKEVRNQIAATRTLLASLKDGEKFRAYKDVDKTTREQLAKAFGALADTFAKVNQAVGIEP